MISLVVFSKDRAMQLDSLLRSVKDHCTGIDRVVVIGAATNDLHAKAYEALFESDDPAVIFNLWRSGRAVGSLLAEELADAPPDHIALAVDDQLFYRPSDFKLAAATLDEHNGFVWSWRLGYDPEFTEECACIEGGCVHWLTTSFVQSPDYSYLWHSDGALYKAADYIAKLDTYLPDWRTGDYVPNDLESAIAAKRSRWSASAGPHLGPLKSTCITWQVNLARRDYASGSPAFALPQTGLNTLALAYLDGRRVDNEKLYKMLQADAQQFNPPGARPTHVYACEEASKFWAGCVR